MRPEAAHRVTVFGSTRNSAATSPGVSRRSLLPSKFDPSDCLPQPLVRYPSSLALNEYFLPRFLEIRPTIHGFSAVISSDSVAISNNHKSLPVFRVTLAWQNVVTTKKAAG
jgi:hypothetical protein